jgi:acetyltransferase-like isoleucine patch superfamily enzyme
MKILNIVVILLPYFLKRFILNKLYGYNISKSAYIGLSYIFPKYLEMHAGAYIGHFNVAVNLDKIVIGVNSKIIRENWITGFPTGTKSKHFSHDHHRKSELIMGRESAITKKHHIDCTNSIIIGDFVTIAGYNSQFLTHSIDIYGNRQDSKPIIIEDYCFVSTGVIILGGSKLPSQSVLAAGAVLNKAFNVSQTMYAGVPAIALQEIQNAAYFKRDKGFVY